MLFSNYCRMFVTWFFIPYLCVVVVWTLDLQLEITDSVPAAALSSNCPGQATYAHLPLSPNSKI